MTDWSARARAALAQKADGDTPVTTETHLSGVLVAPPPTASRNEPASNDEERPNLVRRCDEVAQPEIAGPYRLTPEQMARGHAYPWDERAVGRFLARAKVFRRRGMNAQHSEELAERLHVRDGDSDDRRLCLECAKLRESGGCTAAVRGELARTDQRHHPVVNILYRCEAFSLREGLQ